MKAYLLPKTRSGKWATWLGFAFIILIALKIRFWMPLPTFAIAALGLAGFIMGIMAMTKYRDRPVLMLFPVLSGLVIIMWTAAELIFPH